MVTQKLIRIMMDASNFGSFCHWMKNQTGVNAIDQIARQLFIWRKPSPSYRPKISNVFQVLRLHDYCDSNVASELINVLLLHVIITVCILCTVILLHLAISRAEANLSIDGVHGVQCSVIDDFSLLHVETTVDRKHCVIKVKLPTIDNVTEFYTSRWLTDFEA
jgi:hypothetical protein